jgi:hypothetical protein
MNQSQPTAVINVDGQQFHYTAPDFVREVAALLDAGLTADEIAAMVSFGPPAGSGSLATHFSPVNPEQKRAKRLVGDAVYTGRLYNGSSLLADQARARLRHLETVEQHRQINPLRTPSHTLVVIPPAPTQ